MVDSKAAADEMAGKEASASKGRNYFYDRETDGGRKFQPFLRDAVVKPHDHSEIASNKEVANQNAQQLLVKMLAITPSQFKRILQYFS